MKRAVLCVSDPWNYIQDLNDYSIMIINPDASELRKKYLLENSDYSLLITDQKQTIRNGSDFGQEKVFWYTSGTTGDSKFCGFTKQQVDTMSQTICNAYDITANDHYVGVMPLWHAHGQGFYWATQKAGCQATYLTISQLKKMPSLRPSFITAVPDILQTMLHFDFDGLRFIRSASAPLSNELYQKLHHKFQIPIIEAFGMTEALSHCFTNPLHGEQRMGTIGLPNGIEARIEKNQLHIKGPCVFGNDWYNTGDLACRDSDGYYKILGRVHDQINVRGIKLNPNSLEQHLIKNLPALEQCVIFGKDQVKCVYIGPCHPQQIKNCLVELGSYCRPVVVQQVQEIPRAESGKISRSFLNSIY